MKPFAKTVNALLFACAASVAQAQGFASPSGNIRCYLDDMADSVLDAPMICLIFEADWDLPPDYGDHDPTCDLDSTRMVILPPQGGASARWVCHGDVFWPEPLPQISYGSEWSLLGHECSMATTGVSCRNRSGGQFSINRRALTLD